MKINYLRFKNLNSLAGEWSVDFTAPEYTVDGIFAISGPTGAGKSTILDAICLALYGRTPRLKNISKTTNEIMSRQTGVCFAEVVFETHEGRFRAYWSQRRAREKAEGALQNPEHEISNVDSKQIIASQLTTTEAEIEKRTGMDYDRFVQSMLLAQGGFAAFLQAKGDERAPILEQITGTKIYSDISAFVHRQNSTEKATLDQLKAENKGITLLTSEEEEQTATALEEKNANKSSLSQLVEQFNNAVKWLKTIQNYRNDLLEISKDEATLAKDSEAFGPKRKMLLNGLKAAGLDGDFASLTSLRDQQKTDLELLGNLQIHTPDLESAKTTAQSVFEIAEKQFSDAKTEKDSLFKITGQVRLLDQQIGQKKSAIESIGSQIRLLNKEKEKATVKKEGIKRSIDGFKAESDEIDRYLAGNKADVSLGTNFTGISVTVSRLLDSRNLLSVTDENLKASKKALENKIEEINRLDKELAVVIKKNKEDLNKLTEAKTSLALLLGNRTPEKIQRRKDELILHLADLKKITDYGTERTLLQDGKPCPLCGSIHHPFAEGNVPLTNESEQELAELESVLKEYATVNLRITELTKAERISTNKVVQEKNKKDLTEQQKLNADNEIARRQVEFNMYKVKYDQISESLTTLIIPFGISDIPENEEEIGSILTSLSKRRDEWQIRQSRKGDIGADISKKQAEAGVADAVIETKQKDIASKDKEAEELNSSLKTLTENRTKLFGDKTVDEEEKTVLMKVTETETTRNTTYESLMEKNQRLEANSIRINDLNKKTKDTKAVLDESEKQFKKLLRIKGFADEAVFVSYRLEPAVREKLETESGNIDTRRTQLETRRKDREESLAKEEQKKLTNEEPDVMSVRLAETSIALEALLKEIGALTQKLKDNEEARIRGKEILRKIEIQSAVYDRWARLNSLIGSADGKRYRNFAQGLTLEIMVSHANSQLVKLSDRYLLIRDKEAPLELNVIDNYQAGEIRSTKNLSGGESFIVSLALALGLSRMASRNVRVDSLFLDEGFGSLDEDTLETALSTLAGLRQDGKMIGVISHVGAMKERINTKIIVQPIREGRSVLTGPGCTGT
jgi:DNA repair protein SbcC/Rad50